MFSELTATTMYDPRYCGPLEYYTHYGVEGVPGEGPSIEIWLECGSGKSKHAGGTDTDTDTDTDTLISRAAYRSNGCPSSMAAGSMAARVITGLTVEKALLLTGEDLLRILGGLPEGKEACAERAIRAVRAALGR